MTILEEARKIYDDYYWAEELYWTEFYPEKASGPKWFRFLWQSAYRDVRFHRNLDASIRRKAS